MAVAHDIEAFLARIGSPSKLRLVTAGERLPALTLSWPGLDEILPDGGLPRGVVELAASHSLGGCTSLALASIRAVQSRDERAWCAWVDPQDTLYGPGIDAAGVDLDRLLIVRPLQTLVGRVALKVVASGAFGVVVVDVDSLPGPVAFGVHDTLDRSPRTRKSARWAPEVLVRKLALAAEPSGTIVLLLSDSARPRAVPWPVALRLELSRPRRHELAVRVAKDRRGRVGVSKTVPASAFSSAG